MNYFLRLVLLVFMSCGLLLFIDYLIFTFTKGMELASAAAYNTAYVNHFPRFLEPAAGGQGVLFRFVGAFLLMVPGLLFIIAHLNTHKQLFLKLGLTGTCLGAAMLWMNL